MNADDYDSTLLQRARAGDRTAGFQYMVALRLAGVAKVKRRIAMLGRKRESALKTLVSVPIELAAADRSLKKAQSKLRKAKKRLAEESGLK